MAQFAEAWSTDDAEPLASLLDSDVVLIDGDDVVAGKEAVSDWLGSRMEATGAFEFVPERSETNGSFAYQTGDWSLTRGEGAALGEHTVVFEQNGEAEWLLTAMHLQRDVVNAEGSGNNSFATAFGIGLDQPVEDRISENGQIDRFVVLVPQSGVLDAVLESVPSDQELKVTLYDEEQRALTRKEAASVGGRAAAATRVEPGRYFVAVNPSGGSPASDEPYTLVLSLDRTDIYEINDTFAQAADIAVGEEIVGAIRGANEGDFFRFEVDEPGTYAFAVDPAPAAVHMNLAVFDSQQQRVGRSKEASARGGSVFIERDLSAGTHYVKMHARLWRGEGDPEPYTLRITKK